MHQRQKKNKTTRKDTADSALSRKSKNEKGETITSRKGLANVFGEFYSKLYAENQLGEEVQDPQKLRKRMNTEKKSCNEDVSNGNTDFTQHELQAAIDSFQKSNASDHRGIRAEDINTCDETKIDMIRRIFNEVLKHEDCTPETWRRTRIKVIYKKEMWKEVGNFRPICTLPTFYKLFSATIYNRLYSRVDQAQSEDQGRFGRPYQTLDHLATN